MQPGLLFFIAYVIIIIWVLPKISFLKKTGLSATEIRVLMAAKILLAVISAYYLSIGSTVSDSLAYNKEGKIQYDLLAANPGSFFSEIKNDISKYGFGGIFSASGSFWGYLRFHLIYKFIAFLNIFTGGNFYFNSVIFSSFIFFGNMAFFRIYNEMYDGKKILKLAVCFFLPSMVLYTSCVHKDGFVFLSLGITSYIFFRILHGSKTFNLKYGFLSLLAITCIFLFRNYVLVALLPAMLVAFIVSRATSRKVLVFTGAYAAFAILFFLSGLLNNSLNLPAAVVQRKADFALLEKGSTDLQMNELQPNVISFVKNIPQAINHVLLRPYPFEPGNTGVLLASLELYFYLLLMIAFLFFKRKNDLTPVHPFNIYGFAFVISMMLIIGFTIPNAGAIVRYRSIIWIFLLCPLVCNLDLKVLFTGRSRDINANES